MNKCSRIALTGGYNLEDTKVNETRFLALVLLIAIASSGSFGASRFARAFRHRLYFSDDARAMDEKIRDRDLRWTYPRTRRILDFRF